MRVAKLQNRCDGATTESTDVLSLFLECGDSDLGSYEAA